jgi:putative ABC transport system substrate-binding protein
MGFEIQPLGVREPEDFAAAFSAMVRERPDAILMVTDALTALNRKRVFEFAAQQKLPAIYEYDFLVRDGGLMSYGPDMAEVYDRAADLADRILKGAHPADLPFEQPTRFRLVINKMTLESLGFTSASRMRQRDFFAGVRRRGRHHSLAASRGRARRVECLRSNPAPSTMWSEPVRCWPLT